jgi:two-component system response regulator HydG
VVPIIVPPLRNHPEDIPALAAHFLARALERFPASPVRALSPDAVAQLSRAPWPGNVRELESAIERLVILVREETILPTHLSFISYESDAPPWRVTTGDPWSLKRMNKAYVEWVLERVGGNKIRAAELLGINLSTLYRWQRANEK